MSTYKVLTEPRSEIEAAINKAAADGYRVVSFAVDPPPMMSATNRGPMVTVVMEKAT